ncbi:hypothetical protein DFH08DRAFT_475418 [Mycena albidolilacea]|uniref:SAGA-associated factor 11 n=1 Tax=Mycena albidolilacea TaxID=1033008 RepID=A0AAD7AFI0_9AGAR|nr:hypothetical protein DFH08DRAFT_475418 [Mycena albidolilacea]
MPKSQKEETLSTLASRIFSAMLEDIVMDVTLQSHHETARSRTVCSVCKTRCSSVHAPTHSVASLPSRASTPAANGSASTGTSTPTKSDGNLYLECLHCSRQIASNRYAPHLSSCMGLSQSRRGAARGSAAKPKQPSEAGGRSTGSPEATLSDDGGSPNKGKGKAKGKTDVNLKRKRPESPQLTPNKKQKKQSAGGSPVSRIKAGSDVSGIPTSVLRSPSTSSQSKVPSKLRDSSTASVVERSATPSSRFSSPAPDSPGSSSYSLQSPSITDRGLSGSPTKSLKGSKLPHIVPPKRSPPRPVVDDYLLDDGGDETGSSTDTDSP